MTQSSRDPEATYDQSLTQLLEHFWAQKVKLIHTSSPGIVVDYDAATKRARVQPALRLCLNDGTTMAKPPIIDVPLCQPATGGHLVHHEVRAGDPVWLIFSERGLDQYKTQWGEVSTPGNGILSERDAVAIPWGFEAITPVVDTGWVVQNEDGTTHISLQGESGTVTVQVAQFVHLGGTSGQQLATRQFVEDYFNSHVHVDSAGGNTQPPTQQAPLTGGADLTQKTRAE